MFSKSIRSRMNLVCVLPRSGLALRMIRRDGERRQKGGNVSISRKLESAQSTTKGYCVLNARVVPSNYMCLKGCLKMTVSG